jgi:inorganic pyrophosphatase
VETEFWDYLDQLVAMSQVIIDRPRGCSHPRYPDLVYPLDYGYLAGTTAVDGGGIDVWVGSQEPQRPIAVICTIDLHKRDMEIKILLGCSETEAKAILDFLNDHSMRAMLIERE